MSGLGFVFSFGGIGARRKGAAVIGLGCKPRGIEGAEAGLIARPLPPGNLPSEVGGLRRQRKATPQVGG